MVVTGNKKIRCTECSKYNNSLWIFKIDPGKKELTFRVKRTLKNYK